MFFTLEAHQYGRHSLLLEQMFRLRKRVFADQLNWDVSVASGLEKDPFDRLNPVYLMWSSQDQTRLYGSMRLMPTTGPTLLYDVFRDTFPHSTDLVSPGIWEGTRMCIDTERLAIDDPQMDPGRAFCLLLLALCECALAHGIHTMLSNYEPHLARIYRRAGAEVEELGRSDRYGRFPVCCGAFEVSQRVLEKMRATLEVTTPIYVKPKPVRSLTENLQLAVA